MEEGDSSRQILELVYQRIKGTSGSQRKKNTAHAHQYGRPPRVTTKIDQDRLASSKWTKY